MRRPRLYACNSAHMHKASTMQIELNIHGYKYWAIEPASRQKMLDPYVIENKHPVPGMICRRHVYELRKARLTVGRKYLSRKKSLRMGIGIEKQTGIEMRVYPHD